jgi:hypothetical protein
VGSKRRKTVELRRQRSHSGTGDGQGQDGGGMGIRYLRGWGLLQAVQMGEDGGGAAQGVAEVRQL